MKKIILFSITVLTTTVASAETGTSGISDAADGVVTYMPYVRALCYVIAAIIAVVGAVAVYYTMQTSPQNTSKRIFMTAGSAFIFVCLSLALPQFFGIDGNMSGGGIGSAGSGTSGTSGTGTGFLASTKEVFPVAVSSQRFRLMPMNAGYTSQVEQEWKQPTSFLTSMTRMVQVLLVHTEIHLITSISSIITVKSIMGLSTCS